MLPDYRTAKAMQELNVQSASDTNLSATAGPVPHSLIERVNLQVEARLHRLRDAYRNRSTHSWHWPHPLRASRHHG
jgi:hypothetical protein